MTVKVRRHLDGSIHAGPDLISKLPDHVLVRILSFLPTPDAIKTGFLSWRWRYLWTLVPRVDLDYQSVCDQCRCSYLSRGKGVRMFLRLVDRALLLRDPRSLREVRLRLRWVAQYKPHADSWVRAAMASAAETIDIDFAVAARSYVERRYRLPSCVTAYKSLVSLSLKNFVYDPKDVCSFASVKTLHLSGVTFPPGSVDDVLSKCPCLEVLSLTDCRFEGGIEIDARNSYLASLTLSYCVTTHDDEEEVDDDNDDPNKPVSFFRIFAPPSLARFKFVGLMGANSFEYSIKGLEHLIDAEIDIQFDSDLVIGDAASPIILNLLNDLSMAKSLKISNSILQILAAGEDTTEKLPLGFVSLKHLTLETSLDKDEVDGLVCLLMQSPALEVLSIELSDMPCSPFVEAPSVHSVYQHLSKIEIKNFTGNDDELNIVKFLLKNSIVLLEMSISTFKDGKSLGSMKYLQNELNSARKLIRLPRASSAAEIIFS